MTYILIISILANSPSITTAEYNSKEACIKAGESFKETMGWWSVKYNCSEKG